MSIETICNEIAQKIHAVKQKGYDEGFAAGQESGGGGYDEGFAEGKKSEHDAFWDAFQDYGRRTSYLMAFANTTWNDGNFYPKHDIKPAGSILNMFYYSAMTNVAQRLTECGVTLDVSNAANLTEAFASAQTSALPPLDLKKATVMTRCFQNAKKLTQAPLKNVSGVTAWANSFNGCTALTDIGQEDGEDFSNFGYFSASVNLSQTAINFGTDKMCLRALIASLMAVETPRQEDCFLLIGPMSKSTLTISTEQRAQIDAHIKEYSSGALGFAQFESACTSINWAVAVV